MAHEEPYGAPLPVLSSREREWIEWVLPEDRSGYKAYRDLLSSMTVIGAGRRGTGELIMGYRGRDVDFSSPLAPVLAYGAIETDFGTISITIREILDDQISVEIVNQRSEDVPAEFEEARRWTYSTWLPGMPCPKCGMIPREVCVRMTRESRAHHVLAICSNDGRLWIYEEANQVNHPIPVTNYYNELMLHRHIRDPRIALDSKRLFVDLSTFADEDLARAFIAYNAVRSKVRFEGTSEAELGEKTGIMKRIRKLLTGVSR